MEGGFGVVALVFPNADEGVVVVVAEGLAFVGLVFHAEVTAAGFFAHEGVTAHEFAEFHEVGNAARAFKFGVDAVGIAGDAEVRPEFLAEGLNLLDGAFEAFAGTGHAAFVPNDFAKAFVEGTGGLGAADGHEFFDAAFHSGFDFIEGGVVGGDGSGGGDALFAEVVAHGVGEDEVAVGKALHEGGGTEAVGAVVGEVCLAADEEAGDGALEVVVHPEAAHGIVNGGEDHHGSAVGVVSGDAFIHFEEVAVAFLDGFFAVALDGVAEVEEDAESGGGHAVSGIAEFLGGAGGDVAGCEITEAGVFAFEVVVAFVLGDVVGVEFPGADFGGGGGIFGRPDASVVAEGLGHEGELGLILAVDGDAGWVDLGEAGVGETGAAFVGAVGGGDVAALGVGGKKEGVAVTSGGEDDAVRGVAGDFASGHVACDDAFGVTVDKDEVEHFVAVVHFDLTEADLFTEGGIGAEEELLSGLSAGVKGAGDLRAAEGTVGEEAAVFAGKGNALCDALVDDVGADFGEAIDVRFAGAVVAALDGVVKESMNAVAVVLVIFCGVDTALGGDAVRAAGAVLITETGDVVALLGEAGGGGTSGEAGTDDDDAVFAAVGRVDQLHVEFMAGPLFGKGSGRNLGV